MVAVVVDVMAVMVMVKVVVKMVMVLATHHSNQSQETQPHRFQNHQCGMSFLLLAGWQEARME